MDKKGSVNYINGPVVKADKMTSFIMGELVYVGEDELIGEIIELEGDVATIQVYEETSGMKPGETVRSTGRALSVQLGPGIIGNIFDGIQRPLIKIEEKTGAFIERGVSVFALDEDKKWFVEMKVKKGQYLKSGQIIAEVEETELINHKIMVPPGIEGKIIEIVPDGEYTVKQEIVQLIDKWEERKAIKLYHDWPVRVQRPYSRRLHIDQPLLTGQRVFDTFFPLAKGGTAAIPGGFGAGKTMTQHQLAKWSNADIIVYVGCGERGNEMTDVLEQFPKLEDPGTGKSMMERTILIANTSNMPVAAREASIYTGISIAEYYRDMGYHVALMADSTSRWAEALREIAGRLEEMPAEEGFPAYLPSQLASFYERAGYVKTLDGNREGSVSIIGAVSPPGGDFSEPVTSHTRRFVRAFWALDKTLASARHFPAVNWLESYSEYLDELDSWMGKEISREWLELRNRAMEILKEEDRLQKIVKLVGEDVLPDNQRLILEISRIIKQGFLQQSAFSKVDRYASIEKQYWMLKIIIFLYEKAEPLIKNNIPISKVKNDVLFSKLIKMKENINNNEIFKFKELIKEIEEYYENLWLKYQE
jgi:V/A-type H+/Na+-transporting ATPase subunit A